MTTKLSKVTEDDLTSLLNNYNQLYPPTDNAVVVYLNFLAAPNATYALCVGEGLLDAYEFALEILAKKGWERYDDMPENLRLKNHSSAFEFETGKPMYQYGFLSFSLAPLRKSS